MSVKESALPSSLNAALLLADGTVFWGAGFGALGLALGEICFNTAMTGYQEVLTDPSYQGQIITFTFPHIGNVGCNEEDIESGQRSVISGQKQFFTDHRPPTTDHLPKGASGLIVREPVTEPSNFRSKLHLNDWLEKRGVVGISGIDTRALTRHIRRNGAQNAAIVRQSAVGSRQLEEAKKKLAAHPSLKGMDLAKSVTTKKTYEWTEPRWSLDVGGTLPPFAVPANSPARSSHSAPSRYHVVAVDYGEKLNILRCLASLGCRITVVPAETPARDILALKPNGVFLSNGPGDPAATGEYALPVIRALMDSGVPIFGICLGHQLLGLALGGVTEKMHQGHRGVNHPVKDLTTGRVEITSQNHGFVVSDKGLPADVEVTHRSLFDGTVQGLAHKTKPIFCVQGHPEASPGPHDSLYLFERFVQMMERK